MNHSVFRAIDANINRTREAFRVIEDVFRFSIECSQLTRDLKNVRHQFQEWATNLDRQHLLSMRNAASDVGRNTSTESEYQRADIFSLLAANFARCQQSLRSLEEFSKLVDQDSAKTVEEIRYKIYDLECSVGKLTNSMDRLAGKCLYVLVDAGPESGSPESRLDRFGKRIRFLVECGADLIQIRDKSLTDRQLIQFGEMLVQVTRETSTLAIVNDRVDIALAVKADGVHLGQDEMPISQARKISGPALLIGLSTHSLEQAQHAVDLGANYIGVGPTFPSKTKSFEEFTGVELLRQVAKSPSLPAFAIGGINDSNILEVAESGFHRVAVSGAACGETNQVALSLSVIKQALGGKIDLPGSHSNDSSQSGE